MTSEEWFVCQEPAKMLQRLRRIGMGELNSFRSGHPSSKLLSRKFRLLLMSACRHALQGSGGEVEQKLLDLGNRFCETSPGKKERAELTAFYRISNTSGEFLVIMRAFNSPLGSAAGEIRRY